MRKLLLLSLLVMGCVIGIEAQDAPRQVITELDALRSCNFQSNVEVSGLELGAVVVNLDEGRGCADQLDTPFPVASVPKVFVLGAFLQQVTLGWHDFNDEFLFTEAYVMGGSSDCLSYDDVGRRFTLRYISNVMIWCSDNSATWILMELIGYSSVQAYIDTLAIEGIGPVLPYAEVDRLKLALIDPRWSDVPLHLASQYYRRRITDGLVPNYFDEVPNYSRSQRRDANAQYFYTYDYNTITPRAMYTYLMMMRDDLNSDDFNKSLAAWWFFETLMLTQRQYSTQDLPPTVYVGGKNGWDYGLKAEVSLAFRSFATNEPEAIVIVFAHQTDLYAPDVALPNDENDLLNRYLESISPQIEWILYPVEPLPELSLNSNILSVTLAREEAVEACRENSDGSTATAYLEALSRCWRNLPSLDRLPVNQRIGTGIEMRRVDQEARLTIVYNAPDGQQYAYQYNTLFVTQDNVYWYHRLDQVGTWQIDIYQNLELVYTENIDVN